MTTMAGFWIGIGLVALAIAFGYGIRLLVQTIRDTADKESETWLK